MRIVIGENDDRHGNEQQKLELHGALTLIGLGR